MQIFVMRIQAITLNIHCNNVFRIICSAILHVPILSIKGSIPVVSLTLHDVVEVGRRHGTLHMEKFRIVFTVNDSALLLDIV